MKKYTAKEIEKMLWIPCCHVSGEHNPTHYQERKGPCYMQIRDAFKRFCKELGINPETKSEKDCYWCNAHPEKKKGDGLKLFRTEEETK